MNTTPVILLICAVVALSSACCTPDQWEGDEGALGGYATSWHHGLLKEFIAVSYDAINNRTAAFLDYESDGHSRKYWIVTRYDDDVNTGKIYILDLKTKHCIKKTLRRPFRKACIPDDAKYLGNYSIGLADGFIVQSYEVHSKNIKVYITVQDLGNNECVPVGEAIYGKLRKVDFIQNIGFINVTPGIKNETVFDIPEKCQEKEDYSLGDELTREHYIMAI